MAALLTTNSGDTDKIYSFVEECKKMGLPVLQPDVNLSFNGFGVMKRKTELNNSDHDQIRFGLKTIKNLGEGIAENIVEERKKNGFYKNLEDFLVRNAAHKDLSKKSLEALALSGALDSLVDRNEVLANIQSLLDFIKEIREHDSQQDSLFSLMGQDQQISHLSLQGFENKRVTLKTGSNSELEYILPMNEMEKLFWEKELLGLYISSHPLESRREKIEKSGLSISNIKEGRIKQSYKIYGVMDELKIITTKKGKQMAFAKISDMGDSLEVVIFPDVYKKFAEILNINKIYALKGTLEKRDGEFSFILEEIKLLTK